jgi:hypothetical protein
MTGTLIIGKSVWIHVRFEDGFNNNCTLSYKTSLVKTLIMSRE